MNRSILYLSQQNDGAINDDNLYARPISLYTYETCENLSESIKQNEIFNDTCEKEDIAFTYQYLQVQALIE